jgi:transposase
MANQLKMAKIQAILALRERGWSCRRIAKELGIYRETVSKYILEHKDAQNQPNLPTGSEDESAQNQPNLPTGSKDESGQNRPNPPTGSSGPSSLCEPYREFISESLDKGLSYQRIWQDLKAERGFEGCYDSVKRFARSLKPSSLPFRRMECEPGEEAQVDFGSGAPVVSREDKHRRTHVFRIVLSYSRKGHTESVFHQSTEDFIRCLENSFYHFGGVPRTLVIDNLRAAVTQADWYDPDLNPKLNEFCNHYGTVILPTRPYTPRHKGKIERGIGYVKSNALKGRVFSSLEEQNRHLFNWERSVADTRIHGTTRKQVGKIFEESERGALKPLPADRFPFFHEAERKVHRDGHVEVEKAYYSVPPEYMGRKVWARWDSRVVRVYNQRIEQIAIHVKAEPGRFSTLGQHIAPEKISGVERGAADLLKRAARVGPHTAQWAEDMVKSRGIQGVRVLMGLLSLARRHTGDEIEKACEVAWSHRAFRLRTVRELIKHQAPKQEQFGFIEEHQIIRPLKEYEELVRNAFQQE